MIEQVNKAAAGRVRKWWKILVTCSINENLFHTTMIRMGKKKIWLTSLSVWSHEKIVSFFRKYLNSSQPKLFERRQCCDLGEKEEFQSAQNLNVFFRMSFHFVWIWVHGKRVHFPIKSYVSRFGFWSSSADRFQITVKNIVANCNNTIMYATPVKMKHQNQHG